VGQFEILGYVPGAELGGGFAHRFRTGKLIDFKDQYVHCENVEICTAVAISEISE
jgi:hypothetical protein